MPTINWDAVVVVVFALWAVTFVVSLIVRTLQETFRRRKPAGDEPRSHRPPRAAPPKRLTPQEMERARRFAQVLTEGPQAHTHPDVCTCGGKCRPVDS